MQTKNGKWKFHPACLLFPPLGKDELQSLADDIRERGLLNPIITHEGMVLDGRNRLLACELAGVKPEFKKWDGRGSPLAWAISANLIRRHLTASQRAAVALDLLPMLEEEAKQRQRLSAGRGKKGANKSATFSETGKASQIAATITRTNSSYVEKMKSINRAAPEVIAEVRSGVMTVNDAARLAKLSQSQRQQILDGIHKDPDQSVSRVMRKVLVNSAKQTPAFDRQGDSRVEIWCGDCLKLMRDKIEDGSINAIVTSPPFNRGIAYRTYDDNRDESEFASWLDQVFSELHRVLHDDGSFFLTVGHAPKYPWAAIQMAEIARKHFQLQNQIIWVKSITVNETSHGHFSPIQGERFLNRAWDYVFHFTKSGNVPLKRKAIGVPYQHDSNITRGGHGSTVRCAGDVWFIPHETIHGSEDRAEHPATFPPELAERCLKLAGVENDSLVLDPFCGVNGMIAAAKLGVRGIGIDIDPVYCKSAKKLLG